MDSKTKGGIIVTRISIETIQLAPVEVNHDQTVEEMVTEEGFNNNSDITSAHFPNVNGGKLGSEDINIFLARPVPSGERYSTEKVLELLDGAGFIPEDIPALSPLKAKRFADELWEAGVPYVTALGENSRWSNPNGGVDVVYLDLYPDYRTFELNWIEDDWGDDDWFVVRAK